MSSYIIENNHECKKTKSINNNVVEDKLKYKDYKKFLLNAAYINHEMNRIRRIDILIDWIDILIDIIDIFWYDSVAVGCFSRHE